MFDFERIFQILFSITKFPIELFVVICVPAYSVLGEL